jgi:signal transduction histidine kinase
MAEVKGGRILVVDGDASSRIARTRVLRDAGHTVFETGRFADATQLLRQVRPELLIFSGNLLNGSRLDFQNALEQHEDSRGAMVLRISAEGATPEDRTRAPDADGFLVEPVATNVLLGTTRVLLRLGRAERALRDSVALGQTARDEADLANRIKDDFLATLSHELRTPLHTIVGWVALLRSRPVDDQTLAHALEVIERNVKAQTALVEDLFDISRITLGELQLTWRPVELAAVLLSAVDAIRPTAESRSVTISTEVALAPELAVRGDAARLRQVFWILLSNAVKFTPAGGHVDIRARTADGRVEIEVEDTGRGITPEFLAHMFERFHRADRSTTTIERGLGLGLAIARELVELHGGAVTAASPGVNRGATFVVTLPYPAARESSTRLWRGSGRRAAGA